MAPGRRPTYLSFDKKKYQWKDEINYRRHPEKYHVGRGEQGVLICEPYKSELVAHWHFKTPELATESSKIIFKMFKSYLKDKDFVGADMARKFLQMGFTRARRYANYQGGKKYDKANNYALNEKGTGDPTKAESAAIFFAAWKKAEATPAYARQKEKWKEKYG
jgi:hypothetical protein